MQAPINLFFLLDRSGTLFCESTSPKLARKYCKRALLNVTRIIITATPLYAVPILDDWIVLNVCIRFHFNTSSIRTPNISFLSLCNRLSPRLLLQFSLLLSKSWVRAWKLVKLRTLKSSKFVYFRCQVDFPCTISYRNDKLYGCASQPLTWSSYK